MNQMDQSFVFLSYVDDCVNWYTYEALGKWFVDTLRKILQVTFLRFSHWFMSIRISHMKYHYISVDEARYATTIVANPCILTQLRQIQSFTRPHYHMIWYLQKMIHLPVMNKLRS